MKQALQELFSNPWIKKFPASSLVASALAAMIHPLLAAVGFELPAAVTALTQFGLKVAAELVPTLVEAAKKGMQALADWFEKEMAEKTEVNQAAAQTMVEQAEQVSQTIRETHPDDKDQIADTLGQGFAAYGGAMSQIAEQYSAAMKNAAELNKLIEQMRGKLDQLASQTIEAKAGSTIKNVEMRIKGSTGKQEVRAEGKSNISGVKQTID